MKIFWKCTLITWQSDHQSIFDMFFCNFIPKVYPKTSRFRKTILMESWTKTQRPFEGRNFHLIISNCVLFCYMIKTLRLFFVNKNYQILCRIKCQQIGVTNAEIIHNQTENVIAPYVVVNFNSTFFQFLWNPVIGNLW